MELLIHNARLIVMVMISATTEEGGRGRVDRGGGGREVVRLIYDLITEKVKQS